MIKNLRQDPCLRCLILKKDILGVGTLSNAQLCKRFQTDNDSRHQDVKKERKLIFERGCPIQKHKSKKPWGIAP